MTLENGHHVRSSTRGRAFPASRHGTSLIELVTIVVILGTIASVAIPRMSSSLSLRRVETAAQRVSGDFRMAREAAISRSSSSKVRFIPGTAGTLLGYQLENIEDFDSAGSIYEVLFEEDLGLSDPVVTKFGGAGGIEFRADGSTDVSGAFDLTSGRHTRHIVVSQVTGRVTIE